MALLPLCLKTSKQLAHLSLCQNWVFSTFFFLKPGLTKTFYLMNDLQFSLVDYVCFMLENFKKYFMIWVVSAEDFVPYLVGFVWSWAFQKCPKIECSSTFKLASRLSSCDYEVFWALETRLLDFSLKNGFWMELFLISTLPRHNECVLPS